MLVSFMPPLAANAELDERWVHKPTSRCRGRGMVLLRSMYAVRKDTARARRP